MLLYGFDSIGGQRRSVGDIISLKWTKAEVFASDSLLHWMLRMIELINRKGEKVNFELRLVFYTNDFLEKHLGTDRPLRESLRDRMTIFVVPRGTHGEKFNDDDVTAYELGGLQP
jgi:hypothetical protein